MTKVDIEQAIARARKVGYLITVPNVTRPQHRWLKIAQREGFPYVAVLITAYRGGMSGGIRVMWDASHLPDQVATAAHVLMKLEHFTHAGTETVLQPKSGAIGTLSLEDAKALAAKIAALRGPETVVA
jgi:acetyl/propionyl-CoA carboxylase alpha subunit